MRYFLAALLLAVLTLLGGAPAAAGATLPAPLPGAAPATTGPALEYTGAVPATTGPALALEYTGAAFAAPGSADPVSRAAFAATRPAHPDARAVSPYSADPDVRASLPEATVGPGPVWWSEAGRASAFGPGQRAGADRPHGPHHVPLLGHGALPPRPQGLPLPRGTSPGDGAAASFAVVRAGAALPGVRGPPGATAGQPVLRRSCSTDPSPRPPR
ncbi:hypothetical protein ABZ638_03940 [Streptomyces sp. NPDC007107]|uniref:hypothetical protein n=1 Tax=Streptomyces sp. NPDC007107 TaxID=3156915 RepID=UPI0033F145DF